VTLTLAAMTALLFLLLPLAAFGADLPDSLAPASPPSIRILLDNGEEIETQRIRVRSLGGLTLTGADGREQIIATKRVRRITDEYGDDRTNEVLEKEHGIRVGEPKPRPEPKLTRSQRGPFWGGHAGMASALGNLSDFTETGVSVDLLLDWRTSRHYTYGAKLDFAQFGGKHEFEDRMASSTGGSVSQLRYRVWGASLWSRLLIHSDHRLVPFIHTTLGLQGFTTSLSGSGAKGSKTVLGSGGDLGLGLDARLGTRTTAEFLAAYTRISTRRSRLVVGPVSLFSQGTVEYLQFKGGLVRRF